MIEAKFINEYHKDPFYNMAMDEYLFQKILSGEENCLLRLYSWEPGGITFGLNQKVERAFDETQLGETAAIRRVTGGRAIFHDENELTYFFAANLNCFSEQDDIIAPSDLFRKVAGALVDWLKRLGIGAEFARQSAPSDRTPLNKQNLACFASHSRYEILDNERKIIASAQRVIGDTMMQHGSIKWHGLIDHPALQSDAGDLWQESVRQTLTVEYQDSASVKLRSVLSEHLNLFFDYFVVSDQVRESLERRLELIKSAPLARRELSE